jgi:hypothetical protein
MVRLVPAFCLPIILLAACAAEPADIGTVEHAAQLAFTREHVSGDIYHYEVVVPIGNAPNAALRIHRVVREVAPFVPRRTAQAVMALHGDFSTFVTNFVPVLGDPASPVTGLAPYLAARGIDVWGVDRRWTLPGVGDEVSDFGSMGVAQEIDDIRTALAIARALRGGDKLALMGFSHGAQLAYAYAAVEGLRPAVQRHVDALVPIDYYGDFGPEDEDVRVATCGFATDEYGFVADGFTDSENGFLIGIGERARSAPNEPSPLPPFAGLTNRGALLSFIGQTYLGAPFSPFYHLGAPILDGEVATGLAESSEAAMSAWLAGGTPHQALLETADFDRLLCGEGPMPVNAPLAAIRVPLYYLGAAGGIGVNGLHATTRVSSTDRTINVVQRYAATERVRDFGHTDLLLAADAQMLAWAPLATWLLHH